MMDKSSIRPHNRMTGRWQLVYRPMGDGDWDIGYQRWFGV